MPKIEVNEGLFRRLAGRSWESRLSFEEALSCAKAELDDVLREASGAQMGEGEGALWPREEAGERLLKIELNDTNRPDLWGTAGCARQLRVYHGGKRPEYGFFSRPGERRPASWRVVVEESVRGIRPYLVGFVASGGAVTDAGLRDMIQTQEKLAGNFGRKRRTVSMGLYRISIIKWPIHYRGVDPDSVSFVPLQWETPLTLREILKQHPKGKEYGFIQEREPVHPLLVDDMGAVLSYPPIINSADLGAVQVGDRDLFIELTGTDLASVTLSASIMACDLADQGWTIEPVVVDYAWETPWGRSLTTPFYFQEPVFCSLSRVERFLGERLSQEECVGALERMGVRAEAASGVERGDKGEERPGPGVRAFPPEYRNDFLHAADVAEDVMIGRGLSSFAPLRPRDFTIGRLTPVTLFSRKVKEILVGLGFQEMIYNYLGSRKDLVDNMRADGSRVIRIANPMTENYEYVRDTVLASLLASEAVSAHGIYPHRIFEVGKVAFRDPSGALDTGTAAGAAKTGTATRQYAAFLYADAGVNYNTAAAQVQALFYYLSRDYTVEDSADSRFIPGRAAAVVYAGKRVGVFGEIHPEVLSNWNITMPCVGAEIDLDACIA